MRYVLAFLVSLLAFPALAWETPEQMSRDIDRTNWIVGSGCSGTLIDAERRLIVTAYHCVDRAIRVIDRTDETEDGEIVTKRVRTTDMVPVSQKLYDGHRAVGAVIYGADIVAHRKARDLAILQVVTDKYQPEVAARLLPESDRVWRGSAIWAVGNPLGLDASVSEGRISSTTRALRWLDQNEMTPMLQYTAGTAPGSSGGAIYNEAGFYIATHVGGVPGESINVGIPVSELYDLLRDAGLLPAAVG